MQNCIDFYKFKFDSNMRKKYRSELAIEKNYVIGHIGHFEPVKNHNLIIAIFKKLCTKIDNAKLLLIGNGSLKQEIIELVKNKNLEERIIFLENRNDIPYLLSAMDCFIFPSKFEGLGIAAIEAQASGLPTIISNKVPKIVKLSNCIDIDLNNDIDIWVEKILEYYENFSENDRLNLWDKIVKNDFDINYNIIKLEKKYLEINNE